MPPAREEDALINEAIIHPLGRPDTGITAGRFTGSTAGRGRR
jgi:hypothetical protein